MTTQEYNECVELYANRVLRLVLRVLRNHADAEDIVQISFEVLWKNIESVAFEKARSYLFTVASRKAIDHIRRNSRTTYVEDFAPNSAIAPDRADRHELHDQLHAALNTLSEVQRSCILLRDYEGYAYQEVGEILSLTESQVKVYIFRGRQKLQDLLLEVRH
ncbi:MAG: hypothetical protein RI894_1768 [Bacteroidota bacterium]